MKNLILSVDSYKVSHRLETYPKGAEAMESYIEARAGSHIIFLGLQMYIKDYLLTPITQDDIYEAEAFYSTHGEPFDKEMWQYILDYYNGYMPVKIEAVPEGTKVPNRNILCKISCTDPKCFPVASFLETSLLRAIWYPSSVCTTSYDIKQVIKKYMELTSDTPNDIMFKLNDFGARGVSSSESAGIGGVGHLVNFMGSDNVESIVKANRYYGEFGSMAGWSIAASEHSVITSWGKDNELACYKNFLDMYLKPGKMCACVSDSFSIMNACGMWGIQLKEQIINSGGTLVVRPDSGDPVSTPVAVIERLATHFGTTINSKGYMVLPECIRVIQGDGIDKSSIEDILSLLKFKGYSADNIAFGMGGALLSGVVRDSYGFAMKCSSIKINGEWRDVFKEAPGKNSKRGRLGLYKTGSGEYITLNEKELSDIPLSGYKDMLRTVYQLGKITCQPIVDSITLDQVRANSNV